MDVTELVNLSENICETNSAQFSKTDGDTMIEVCVILPETTILSSLNTSSNHHTNWKKVLENIKSIRGELFQSMISHDRLNGLLDDFITDKSKFAFFQSSDIPPKQKIMDELSKRKNSIFSFERRKRSYELPSVMV